VSPLGLLRRRTRPSVALGVLVAGLYVVVATSLAHALTQVLPVHSLNIVYVLGILVIGVVWGLAFGVAMAVVSTIAFDLFLTSPSWTVRPLTGEFLAVLAVFLAVGLLAGSISRLVRTLAAGPDKGARDALGRLLEEQDALRRLATMVARNIPAAEILDGVAREMGRVLEARYAVVARYEPDDTATICGIWNFEVMSVGSRWPLDEGTVMELVARTRKAGRVDVIEGSGRLASMLRERGIVSAVGCPIWIGQSLWGVVIAASNTRSPLAEDTEERMGGFAELAGAAIANAKREADLRASRARVVSAADETRRRIERDLHDGTQQRLVSISLQMRGIEAFVPPGLDSLRRQVSQAIHAIDDTVADLQEISRGVHPAILAKGGLPHALKALARRSTVQVELNVFAERRLPERFDVTVYYVVSEALLNAAKHAQASLVHVDLKVNDDDLRLSIRDDGIGGADPRQGSGLIGLTDRIEALGGWLKVVSPAGRGTTLVAEIPTNGAVRPGTPF
jgi:signal transduction histidine kinase